MGEIYNPQNDFDAFYYTHGCGAPYERNEQWLRFFQSIADHLISDFQPQTVLDGGCAKGFLVEGFRNRGVEAWGIDISDHAIQEVHESVKPFCWVGSITEPFPRRYDLIVSIEVVEHMPGEMGKKAISNLCAFSDRILFTSTPFDYKETTHYNVQPPEYWAREFARHGFFRDVDYDASYITAWATCFRKSDQPVHQLAYDYERRYWLLWKENTDLRALSNELRDQVRVNTQNIEQLSARENALHTLLGAGVDEAEGKVRDLINRNTNYKITTQRLMDENTISQEKINSLENTNLQLIEQEAIARETIQNLTSDLTRASEELENAKNKEKSYVQRWEALEKTRTWKVLSWLHKARNKSK